MSVNNSDLIFYLRSMSEGSEFSKDSEFQKTMKLQNVPNTYDYTQKDEYGEDYHSIPFFILDQAVQLVDQDGKSVLMPADSFFYRDNELIHFTAPDKRKLTISVDQSPEAMVSFTVVSSKTRDLQTRADIFARIGLTYRQVALVTALGSNETLPHAMEDGVELASMLNPIYRAAREGKVAIYKEVNEKVAAIADPSKQPLSGRSNLGEKQIVVDISYRFYDASVLSTATIKLTYMGETFTFENFGRSSKSRGLGDWICEHSTIKQLIAINARCAALFGMPNYQLLLQEAVRNFRLEL